MEVVGGIREAVMIVSVANSSIKRCEAYLARSKQDMVKLTDKLVAALPEQAGDSWWRYL